MNQLIKVWWGQTMQHSERHDCDLVVDLLWKSQPVETCKSISDMVISMKAKHQHEFLDNSSKLTSQLFYLTLTTKASDRLWQNIHSKLLQHHTHHACLTPTKLLTTSHCSVQQDRRGTTDQFLGFYIYADRIRLLDFLNLTRVFQKYPCIRSPETSFNPSTSSKHEFELVTN